jgi:hypothetical protein
MKNIDLKSSVARFDLAARCPDRGVKRVAVLFARTDSVYKTFSFCDVFDIDRDARTWPGGNPVIVHPPCRAWGRLRSFSRPAPGERDLGFFAVAQVRKNGGVLEHPVTSLLWREAGLPAPGAGVDEFGGWSMSVPQFWFGHLADKLTWLYVVGCDPSRVPALPFVLGQASIKVDHMSHAEREKTPEKFAVWLCDLALRCGKETWL